MVSKATLLFEIDPDAAYVIKAVTEKADRLEAENTALRDELAKLSRVRARLRVAYRRIRELEGRV